MALAENDAEIEYWRARRAAGDNMVDGVPWTVDEYFEREEAEKGGDGGLGVTQCTKSTLVCLDNMEHEHTTAHLVTVEAEKLGLSDHLQFVVADAFDILDAPTPPRAGAATGGGGGGGGGGVVDWKSCSYDLMFLDGITGWEKGLGWGQGQGQGQKAVHVLCVCMCMCAPDPRYP